MTALLAPHRPRWRNLALLALLLAPLLWPLQQLAERYYRNELTEQNRQTLDLYVANLLGTLNRYEVLPRILGDLPALRAVLQQDSPQVRDNANRLLKRLRNQTGADVIYLMATDGNTLAASNWDEEDSFVDRNFASAPTSARPWRDVLGASSASAPPPASAAITSARRCATATRCSACWWSRSIWITPRRCGAAPRSSCW